MTVSTTIRPATPLDARTIAEVHVASWQTTYAGIVPPIYLDGLSADARLPIWDASLRDVDYGQTKFTFVAEQANQIIGFADGGPARDTPDFQSEIYAIYLLVGFQGLGIGRRLLRTLAEQLVAAGNRSAIVGVLAANPSCGFYETLGARYIHSQQILIAGTTLEERFYGWQDIGVLL